VSNFCDLAYKKDSDHKSKILLIYIEKFFCPIFGQSDESLDFQGFVAFDRFLSTKLSTDFLSNLKPIHKSRT